MTKRLQFRGYRKQQLVTFEPHKLLKKMHEEEFQELRIKCGTFKEQ